MPVDPDADRRSVRKRCASGSDTGFTAIEMLIAVGIVSVVVALAVPGLVRARRTASEVGAIGSLRVTAAAQKAYASTCGHGGYARSFTVLGSTGPEGAPAFISDDLGRAAMPVKAGYRYTLEASAVSHAGPDDCASQPTVTAYYATASPTSVGWTGSRSFAVGSGSVIWELPGGSAPPEPFSPPAAPVN